VSDCTYECIRLGSEHPDCPAHGVTATLRDKVARLTAALAQSEEARREAEEHADRVERLGQIAVDNARDRAVAAEARASAAEEALRAVRCLAEDWRAYADKPWADMGEAILTLLAARALSSAPRDAGEGAAP
jgi:hypothetical protein